MKNGKERRATRRKRREAAPDAKRQSKKNMRAKKKSGLFGSKAPQMRMERLERTQDLVHMLFDGYDEDSGIFWKEGVYSKMYEMQDVSFSKAQDENKFAIMKKWMELFHSFSRSSYAQVIVTTAPSRNENSRTDFYYGEAGLTEGEKKIAGEMNRLIEQSLGGRNGSSVTSRRYIVISLPSRSREAARDSFYGVTQKLENKLHEFRSGVRECGCEERLEMVFRAYRGEKFSSLTRSGGKALMSRTDGGGARPVTVGEYAKAAGLSVYDVLAPRKADMTEKDYIVFGDQGTGDEKYARVCYIPSDEMSDGYPSVLSPQFMNSLQNIEGVSLTVSMGIHPLAGDEATKIVSRQITSMKEEIGERQKRDNRAGLYGVNTNETLQESLDDALQLRYDIMSNSERLFQVSFFFMVRADSLEELEAGTLKLIEQAAEQGFTVNYFNFEQPEGLKMVMPFADPHAAVRRTLTSDCIACCVPFNAKDIMQPGSVYYGMNMISRNAIFADRKKLINGNGCVLAMSGAGKSFSVKMNIEQILLRYPEDDVIVIDPQNEYRPLIDFFGGQEITISTSSGTYINPFDLDLNYDEKAPVKAKTEYILAFTDTIVSSGSDSGLTGVEKSIVDRCCMRAFEAYEESGFSDQSLLPSLPSFYRILRSQPEREAKILAGNLERFVTGTNDIFARRTNVDMHSRFVSFNISRLPESLQTTGYLVVLDHIMNTLARNKSKGKNTWIFIDEFHVLLRNPFSAAYIAKIYKEGRKYGAFPLIITQNISDVVESPEGNRILGNSEFAMILKQKPDDMEQVASIFGISEGEQEYIGPDCPRGQGVLVYSKDTVVFRNIVPEDSLIYELNNTDAIVQSRQ